MPPDRFKVALRHSLGRASTPASTICAALRRRLPGYYTATPDTLQRRFLQTGGLIIKTDDTIMTCV